MHCLSKAISKKEPHLQVEGREPVVEGYAIPVAYYECCMQRREDGPGWRGETV